MKLKIDIGTRTATGLKVYAAATSAEVYTSAPVYEGAFVALWTYTGATSISGQYIGIEVTFSGGEVQRAPVAKVYEQKVAAMGPYEDGLVGSIWAGTMPMPAGSTISAQKVIDTFNSTQSDQLKLVDDQPTRPLTRVFIDGKCYAIKHGAYYTGTDGTLVNNLFSIVNGLRTIAQSDQGYLYTPLIATTTLVAGKFGHLFNDRSYNFKDRIDGGDTVAVNLVKTLSNGTNSWTGTTFGKLVTNDANTSITGFYYNASGVNTSVYTHNYNCVIPVIFSVTKA